jgi:hypothetical protein
MYNSVLNRDFGKSLFPIELPVKMKIMALGYFCLEFQISLQRRAELEGDGGGNPVHSPQFASFEKKPFLHCCSAALEP